jgi:hypothetical protein
VHEKTTRVRLISEPLHTDCTDWEEYTNTRVVARRPRARLCSNGVFACLAVDMSVCCKCR